MRTLKVLGFLMAYPSIQTVEVLSECREILKNEKWLEDEHIASINKLMTWLENTDLLDVQEEYVALFDRTPSLCLHLFEHIHGDSRERGQALVDLSEVYKDAGLLINTEEMPDYLPLFLEYLSVIDQEEARSNLGEIINVVGTIGGRLKNRKSEYAVLFDALINAAATKPDAETLKKALEKSSGAPFTFEEMDKEWEEQQAFENSEQTTGQAGTSDGCPQAEEMLARMNMPLDSKEKA